MDFTLEPTLAGAIFAALAIAGGAPLFSSGLRTLRLLRHFARLQELPLTELPAGFVHTSGRVLLDSPLFSPLSGKACAGFRLEVQGGPAPGTAAVEERRPFRIVRGEDSARVMAGTGRWRLSETARREVGPGEAVSENLASLLQDCPEFLRLRRMDRPVVLVERALFAGSECHVIGHARHARPFELHPEMELARTGTDDDLRLVATHAGAVVEDEPTWEDGTDADETGDETGDGNEPPARSGGPFGIERRQPGRPYPGEVGLWVDGGGQLDFVLISDAPPAREDLVVSPWRALGVLLGPALSLGGLLYLAHAADRLRNLGRF